MTPLPGAGHFQPATIVAGVDRDRPGERRRAGAVNYRSPRPPMKKSILCPMVLGLMFAGCAPDETKTRAFTVDPRPVANASPPAAASNPAGPRPADPPLVAIKAASAAVSTTTETMSTAAGSSVTADQLFAWRLRPEDFDDELTQTGRVTRFKAAATDITTTPLDNDALASLITAKLLASADLGPLSLGVTVSSSVVTLTGQAHSRDQIGRALALALATPGVTQVVSLVTVPAS